MKPVLQRRMSRRMVLADLGAAGVGMVILGACGGSSSDNGSTAPDDAASTAAPSDTGGSTTAVPATDRVDVEPTTTDAAEDVLRWQHVSLGFVSAFVLLRGNEAAVVDTGSPGSASAILDGLGVLGASWSDVRHVVLTHKHGDHVGSLDEVLAEATSATVYAGEGDIAAIASSRPLQAVGDGDEVLGLGVLDTPGHTPGSISLFDTETGLLVAGDAITGDGAGTLLGPNPEFTPDMDTAVASVAKLAGLDARVAAFGHVGPPVEDDVMVQLAAIVAG